MPTPQSPGPKHRPYLRSGATFEIGLRPMDQRRWIDLGPDHVDFMAAKRARLAGQPENYYRTLPRSRPAQHELQDLLVAHLLSDHPHHFAMAQDRLIDLVDGTAHDLDGPEPLVLIGGMVEEDFVLIENVDGRDVISAASNAYTSSGRIVSSVGHPMPWAHQLVPALNEQLGARIDRILANVKAGAPVERFNWFLTPIGNRLFPEGSHAANVAATEQVAAALAADPRRAGELLWIRVERQTLLRLPETGALTFGIHTYSDPLSAIAADRESLEALHALLGVYSEERLVYSAMLSICEPVLRWIEELL